MSPWDELPYWSTPKFQYFPVTNAVTPTFTGDPQNVLLIFGTNQISGAPTGVSPDPNITAAHCIPLTSGAPWFVVDAKTYGPLTTVPWFAIGVAGAGPFGCNVYSLSLSKWPARSKTKPSGNEVQSAINTLSNQIKDLVRSQRGLHEWLNKSFNPDRR